MARTIGIGMQDFEKIITHHNFYVDKTLFIKEWWENDDDVTLITHPRRFGKTLNMSMLERFFSVKYAGQGYVNGYWNEIVSFIKNLFNSTFKTNPFLEKAIMTGITRVSKESIFLT